MFQIGLKHQEKLIQPRSVQWIVVLFMLQYVAISRGQGWQPEWQTGWPGGWQTVETVTGPPGTILGTNRYNIPWGSGGINISAGLRGTYVDNVYLTQAGARSDFILIPECDVGAFFPVGQSNTFVLDLGLAYYEYLKNTTLNTGVPIISPKSQLAFNIHSGDFSIQLSERFSYQESPLYEEGGAFYNVFDTALFRRYDNLAGIAVTWDLHDLVVDGGFHHENLLSDGSFFNYVDHASEMFNADAMLTLSPVVTAGLEAVGSLNNFDNKPIYDTWRAKVGPRLHLKLSRFFKVSTGAGYERIDYDSPMVIPFGVRPENTYYAYANIFHEINRVFGHSLEAWHDNQLGFNAANLKGTHLSYHFYWEPNDKIVVAPHASMNWFDESFGSDSASLYHENFTYLTAGVSVQYQLAQHWRTSLSWDYRLKDSDIQDAGYAQNQASLEVIYQF